jgi:glycosyltransferase involved in cell wall biosynthesis
MRHERLQDMLDQITPLIITHDEAPNIARTLDKLTWARRIVVIDSGSTDDTVRIARSYPQVEVISRPFTDFASQCNFGLTQVTSPWVLSLDADYELSDALLRELRTLAPAPGVAGFRAHFIYRIFGRTLRATLYPPRTVLYRREAACYRNEGHGHRVVVDGDVCDLSGAIFHDDRKPLTRWFASQQRYARIEAEHLLALGEPTRGTDRLRLMGWPAPIGVLFYTLFVKGCLLNGWAGWYYVLQRVIAEALIAIEIADRRLRRRAQPADVAGTGAEPIAAPVPPRESVCALEAQAVPIAQ